MLYPDAGAVVDYFGNFYQSLLPMDFTSHSMK